MSKLITIVLVGFIIVGCNEVGESNINNDKKVDVDSVIQLPQSQLLVDDSLKKYNYKGKGIRDF